MKGFKIGISASRGIPASTLELVDFIEIKKITVDEVSYFKKQTEKPLLFHVQYFGDDTYYLPSVMDFKDHLSEIDSAYRVANPEHISFHFGLASKSASVDSENYVAVAESPLLTRDVITQNLEKNLKTLKHAFPASKLLIENLEFVPEAISRGAYRYIQEADFFTYHTLRWIKMGILDGIVFDIAHALIAAGNHPFYNGIDENPANTNYPYLDLLKEKNNLIEYFEGYISQMPLAFIREIHISGILRLSNGAWVDSHREIGQKEIVAFNILLDKIKYCIDGKILLTLEYSRNLNNIPWQIEELRKICKNSMLTRNFK